MIYRLIPLLQVRDGDGRRLCNEQPKLEKKDVMNLKTTFGIVFGLLVASMSPVSAHDEEAKAPVIEESKKDSSDDQWYDFRKVAPSSEVGFDFHKELRLRTYGFETAKKKKGPYVWNQSLIAEISLRPLSWEFESPLSNEDNKFEVGVYARYETHKFRTKKPDKFRWYENSLSLGIELTYINLDEHGAVFMITLRSCGYISEERGDSENQANTYELFYQNSAGYEISGAFEYYGLFFPLERGSRSGLFPTLMLEGGYAEHREEKLKSTLTKLSQIDKPHDTTRYWYNATFWLFQYDFKGLIISIGGSTFGEDVRASQFRHPNIRPNKRIRTFTGGPTLRIVILDRLVFEGAFQYGRSQKQGDHIRVGQAGMRFAF